MSEKYPKWKRDRCEHCAAGMAMREGEAQTHFNLGEYEWELRYPVCTAPTEAEHIAQLEQELAEAIQVSESRKGALISATNAAKRRVGERDEALAKLAEAEKQLKRYDWRPISEIHEDYGECVLININDPGCMATGNNLDTDFDESFWTHFAEAPKLSNKEAARLIAAMKEETSDAVQS